MANSISKQVLSIWYLARKVRDYVATPELPHSSRQTYLLRAKY